MPGLQSRGKSPAPYDPLRTLRMFGFGLCWYGPYQYYWYNLLDYFMPLKNTANFLAKVCAYASTSTPTAWSSLPLACSFSLEPPGPAHASG